MVADAADGATIFGRGVLSSAADLRRKAAEREGSAVAPPLGDIVERQARAATAAIMLAGADDAYVGLSSGWELSNWKWWPFFDQSIGEPAGPPVRDQQHVWRRNFSNGSVWFNCSARPFTGDFLLR
jgi:hypothetical protein